MGKNPRADNLVPLFVHLGVICVEWRKRREIRAERRHLGPSMANATFGRGACVAPYLQLSNFPGTKGCQYGDEGRNWPGLGTPFLTLDSHARPIMYPRAIRPRDGGLLSAMSDRAVGLYRQ